jgi:hypothetical protein
MLIEAIKTMDNEKLDNSLFVGQDIDLTCVKMCALNLLFFNVNGYSVWGDSLAMECNKVYETARSYLGGSIRELRAEAFEKFKENYLLAVAHKQRVKESIAIEMTEAERENVTKHTEQLMLF